MTHKNRSNTATMQMMEYFAGSGGKFWGGNRGPTKAQKEAAIENQKDWHSKKTFCENISSTVGPRKR